MLLKHIKFHALPFFRFSILDRVINSKQVNLFIRIT